MMNRYYWKTLEEGNSPCIWDGHADCKVNILPGDVLNLLNLAHEQHVMLVEIKQALEVEQRAGMDLARKLINN